MNQEPSIKRCAGRPPTGAKDRVFHAALDLFSTKGYAEVGIRDIAEACNVKTPSIYKHFETKEAILDAIYQYFFENYGLNNLDVRTLINMIPTTPPKKIFELLLMPTCSSQTKFDTMRKVVSVAILRYGCDPAAAAIVSEIFFVTTEKIALVLNRMQELDLIEPVNISLFTSVYISSGLSASLLLGGQHAITFTRWRDSQMLLLSLIKKK